MLARQVAQPLHVREVAAHLDREHEARRALRRPSRRPPTRAAGGRRCVHLDGVEGARSARATGGRAGAPGRRRRGASGRSSSPSSRCGSRSRAERRGNACDGGRRRGRDDPRAADQVERRRPRTARRRPATTASPRSRTSSCAAAMSTERAGFSEHTASTRPAARWQSESASEPMIRKPPRNAVQLGGDLGDQRGPGRFARRGSRSPRPGRRRRAARRRAARRSPRVAVHSSPVPKSWTKPNATSRISGPSATARDSAKYGMPRLAFSEPSIGSSTTRVSLVAEGPLAELLGHEREVVPCRVQRLEPPHDRRLRSRVDRSRVVAAEPRPDDRLAVGARRQLGEHAAAGRRPPAAQTSSQTWLKARWKSRPESSLG